MVSVCCEDVRHATGFPALSHSNVQPYICYGVLTEKEPLFVP